MTGWAQKPPRHSPLQQVAPAVQPAPIEAQIGAPGEPASPGAGGPASVAGGVTGGVTGGGASQCPLVQLEVQQSAPVVQIALAAAQTVAQVPLAGSQWFEQQSPSVVHVALSPRHAPGGKPQRPSLLQRSSSLVAPQQPD